MKRLLIIALLVLTCLCMTITACKQKAEEVSAPPAQEEVTPPAEAPAPPAEEMAPPAEAPAPPAEEMAPPAEAPAPPVEEAVPPAEAPAPPAQ